MKFIWALIVWALIAFVIGLGIVLAVKGSLWLLLLSLLGFIFVFSRWGCIQH